MTLVDNENKSFIAQTDPRKLSRCRSARPAKGVPMKCRAVAGSLAICAITIAAIPTAPPLAAHAKNGDTHITGQGTEQTLDCNESTLLVDGTANYVNAKGTCWAVTVMGSSNVVMVDTIINNITVYGYDETVFFRNGDPFVWDRGRELGMVNRLQRVPGSVTSR